MDAYRQALSRTPIGLQREMERYGGTNPFGRPMWRVVLTQCVLEQSFGVMRHMPLVSDDVEDAADVEPERISTGEFWTPRYQVKGWILERWFPAHTWGDVIEWRNSLAADGMTALKGDFPKHGDWWMVSTEALEECPSAAYWKDQIQRELRQMAAIGEAANDPAMYLRMQLYAESVEKEAKEERFRDEVNAIHRGVTDPTLATVSRSAQQLRNGMMNEWGMDEHLAAG
jgi:hypothetical protein